MTKEEIFEKLQPYGCVAVYITGSTANPYIRNPRDLELVAVFQTQEQTRKAPKIVDVHYYYKGGSPVRFFIWGYVFHFMNAQKQIGEKYQFVEPTIEQLVAMANGIINSSRYEKQIKMKFWYRVAMIKAIEKYGYDSIPEEVVSQINDLHDLKITYDQFHLE